MGRKICSSCKTTFDDELLKQRNSEVCLICGAPLLDESETQSESAPEELVDWYYYEFKNGSGYLSTVYREDDERTKLAYTFKAPPRDENGSSDAAKEILRRKYKPDAFVTPPVKTKPEPVPKCPRCGSTAIQMVPKKWSPLTGFRTNRVDRVCINCRHKF